MTIAIARALARALARTFARALGLAISTVAVTAMTTPLDAQPAGALEYRVIRGAYPGPTVALVAGVHGGKRSAIRALEALGRSLDTAQLRGRILLVPVASRAGFRAGLAQTSPEDGLNLNRVFPGRSDGSPTERLAAQILREIVAESDYLVDLHGSDGEEAVGSFAYAAHPGIDPAVDSAALALARAWGVPRVVWDTAGPRTLATSRFLQTAAHLSGVPAITVFEAGDVREDTAAVTAFRQGAERALAALGLLMVETGDRPAPVVHARRDVTLAATPGIWAPAVRPGQRVRRGELLGTLAGSLNGVPEERRAAVDGVVLHQRLVGAVRSNTPLVILAVLAPDSTPTP